MVIVLPSLGMTRFVDFIHSALSDDLTTAVCIFDSSNLIWSVSSVCSLSAIIHRGKGLRWPCIFSKDNGALYVNYLCTSTFLGTVSELMRLPELFVYCVKLCFARSEAEIAAIRKSVLWDFQIGSQ